MTCFFGKNLFYGGSYFDVFLGLGSLFEGVDMGGEKFTSSFSVTLIAAIASITASSML